LFLSFFGSVFHETGTNEKTTVLFSVPIRYKVFRLDNLEKDIREQALNMKAESRI